MPARHAFVHVGSVLLLAATLLTGHAPASAVPGRCPPPRPNPTAPRVYAIDAAGDLRLYLGDRHGHLTGGDLAWPAGGQWRGFRGIATADFTGDGWPDVAGIDAHGDLRLYSGSASGTLSGGAPMGPAGVRLTRLLAGDFDRDGRQDLAGVDTHGILRLYRGDGHGQVTGGAPMGPAGWGRYQQLAAADFTGDGVPDVIGVDAHGGLSLYQGASGRPLWPGQAWNGYRALTAVDLDDDGFADLLGIDAHGVPRLYRGDGTGHLATDSGAPASAGTGLRYLAAAAPNLPALCPGGTRLAILPLGDSITYGYSSADGNGYRRFLADLLDTRTGMGWGWLYEGGVESGPRYWSHEGHGGWRIDAIDAILPPAYPVRPNLVLLDAGTNDAGQGYPAATMLARMSALLDHLLARYPGVRIEVAQLTLDGRTPAAIRAEQDFNAALPALATSKGGDVLTVNMTGVHLSADGVHPDDTGYRDMATRWYSAAVAARWLP